MRYTLRQLEIFVAVCRLENVSKAADLLCLSQSATSTSLGELEKQFSIKLFDRIGKSLCINDAGKRLLPQAIEQLIEQKKLSQDYLGLQFLGICILVQL